MHAKDPRRARGPPGDTLSGYSAGSDDLALADGWRQSSGFAAEPMRPWSLEAQADVVAIGLVHEPVEHAGRAILKLELREVIKGSDVAKTVFPEDKQAFLGCMPPEDIPRPSDVFAPGTEVLAYLTKPEGGELSILQLMPRPDAARLEAIRRFVKVGVAIRAPSPAWSTILPPNKPIDDVTYWALEYARPAGAATALRAVLSHTLDQADAGLHPDVAGLNSLAGLLTSTIPDADSLPVLERLVRWVLARDTADTFTAHWPMCSPGRLLGRLPVESVSRWEELLREILARSVHNDYAVQGTANALAHLPDGAGVSALLEELGNQRSAVAASLTWWTHEHPDDLERRTLIHARVQAILQDPTLRGDEHLSFRRHLDNLVSALAD